MKIKKIIKVLITLGFIGLAFGIIYNRFWPFAWGFIDQRRTVGDSLMHVANILSFKEFLRFPITAWKPEWGGYPMVEGYPWLHYYLIQPLLSIFKMMPGLMMDYYMAGFMLAYYALSFLLFFYVSGNGLLALFFSLVLIYGADSQMPMTVNAFMTFTASMMFLPLLLMMVIKARKNRNLKLLALAVIVLTIAYISHGAMTGIVIIPALGWFLALNMKGKISKGSIMRSIGFFGLFGLLSALQIYQFIDYGKQGYLRGVKPFALEVIPGRLVALFSWVNPILLPLLILFVPLFFLGVRKNWIKIKPYFLAFLMSLIVFTLMVFNITSMNLVLLAERALWGLSLMFLMLYSRVIGVLVNGKIKKSVLVGVISLVALTSYVYFIEVVKPDHLIPNTLRAYDPYDYVEDEGDEVKIPEVVPDSKYDMAYSEKLPLWSQQSDNYRVDGINWSIYSNWNIWSFNTRYKGRFPAAKELPLEWSGLVSAAQQGLLGEAGTADDSQWAINQTLFWFDWYGIRHLEIGELGWPDYLLTGSLIESKEKLSKLEFPIYLTIKKEHVGPIYAPTKAKILAVVAPEAQYDNFIRTLSYSNFDSSKIIPIYLGSRLSSLKKRDLKYFDGVFLYGYKEGLFSGGKWQILEEYVNGGGRLIIETGQKVRQTANFSLPKVMPMKGTKMTVVSKPWSLQVKRNDLTKGVKSLDFNPVKTKYLPYSISETSPEQLRDWAEPVLVKDGQVVMAYGELGEGRVVWSGINLPFHAIDNRNVSETVVLANALDWFFPEIEDPIEDFEVNHESPEKIMVKSSQGKGFLIKENYNPGWSARINNKKAKVFKAGLMQMYIPFDKDGSEQILWMKYYGQPTHWILFSVSLVALFGISVYILFSKNILSKTGSSFRIFKFLREEDD